MVCLNCGKENPEAAKFCAYCGTSIGIVPFVRRQPLDAETVTDADISASPVNFSTAVSTCFSKYFIFSGRASRSEYWWFILFYTLISWGTMLIDPSLTTFWLCYLIFFFPLISVATRRLHDTNRSGWWQLIGWTVIGLIPLTIWLATKGSNQENRYGKSC